jgi:hypothetical protein
MDALQSKDEDTAPDWLWQSAGKVDADGYVVEIRLPLQSIRFKGGSDVRMGMLFFRKNSRLGVSWSWPEMKPGEWVFEAHAPVAFGELKQPMLLEVIPSATYSHNQARSLGSWQDALSQGDFGASVKYGITSTMTLDATVNPDFSQVESDAFEGEVNQLFQREAAVLHGGARPLQPRWHRRRLDHAHRGSHAPHRRSERRRQADRQLGTVLIRDADGAGRVRAGWPADVHDRTRAS